MKSLDEITTGFNIFEKNQVLTHEQLNTLGNYLDDQERLTRVGEIGVGLCCGLRPSLAEFRIRVTKGIGGTTDGDLFRFGADVVYDRFKPYDEGAPVYEPFFGGAAPMRVRMPLFELVKAGDRDQRAIGLDSFTGRTGFALESMVAVLYMESFVRDPDLCTGADCDNLGKDAVNTPRVLLTDRRSAARFQAPFDTPDMAARDLDAIVAVRPIMMPGADTPAAIATAYVTASAATLVPLTAALAKIFPRCAAFLGGVFAADPAPVWVRVLNGLQAQFTAAPRGVQYYYDFLLDVIDTYTDFKMLMYGDMAICAPDFGGFPKHVLLGVLTRDRDGSAFRTPFYPSPAVSAAADRRRHARFLARKLDALIINFELPQPPIQLRVTPSQLEDRRLEDRAIPHYYKVTDGRPIHRSWNYFLEQAGMSAFNYGYGAPSYQAQGGAASPMTSPIAPFTLFRVEGHLGRNVEEALALINREIRTFNLPFTARAVMLDPDRTKLPWHLPFRFTDLHRIHYVLRNDIANQLEEVSTFGDSFKTAVDDAIKSNIVVDDVDASDSTRVGVLAANAQSMVKSRAALGIAKLARPFEEYQADTSWKADVGGTMESAGQFKANLTKVVKTEFATPFDNLIASPHVHWLPWLEDLIRRRNEKEQTKVLFGTFLTEHPGLEHRAGVPAGGTLVLAHDTQGLVVADFALPYNTPAPVEEREEEPPLRRPIDIRPPFIVKGGINILPSRDRVINEKLDQFKIKLQPELNKAIDYQGKFIEGLKDSLAVFGGAAATTPKGGVTGPGTKVQDPVLDAHLKDARSRIEQVDFIKNQLLDPANDAGRQQVLEDQLKQAETDVAESITVTTKYVAQSTMDVSAGSDGSVAMNMVSEALNRLSNRGALAAVKAGLEEASAGAAKADVKNVIGVVLKQKGLGR